MLYVYGIHPVEELLRRSPAAIHQIAVAGTLKEVQFETIQELVKPAKIHVQKVSEKELDEWCDGGNHQRIAARVEEFPYSTLEEILEKVAQKPQACLLALAQVQDPGNLGAILRSAAAMNVDGVLLPRHRAASVTPAVVRASAGMAFQLPIAEVPNLAKTLTDLKEQGFWIAGTVARDGQDLWTMDWDLKVALVMGGEHKGMRPGVEKTCDFRLQIPLESDVESLNVSVAAAITLYERRRFLHTLASS